MIPQLPACVLQLSATPRGARLGRLLAVEQLRAWGLRFDTAEQVLTELISNAVSHGRVPGRDFRLGLSVDGARTLRIELTDTRADRLPDPQAGGRGLAVVAELADRWGVELGPAPWKTVWAELDSQ
ncbi:ATP-binding protein [Streptomyces sp. BR123]|uniref:ATP-binding protein n=1 Tax=Streptomyces sp. BR123 TaxID=2749828 RepID=UPI0028124455|nr:ATP-binding protein [Streptomyces sp. BR123]